MQALLFLCYVVCSLPGTHKRRNWIFTHEAHAQCKAVKKTIVKKTILCCLSDEAVKCICPMIISRGIVYNYSLRRALIIPEKRVVSLRGGWQLYLSHRLNRKFVWTDDTTNKTTNQRFRRIATVERHTDRHTDTHTLAFEILF